MADMMNSFGNSTFRIAMVSSYLRNCTVAGLQM